jgi:hypothetical protein
VARTTRRRNNAPIPYEVAQVGITGMRDSYDPTTGDPKKATLIQNGYPYLAEQGGGILDAPGFRLFGTQLGSAGLRTGQLVYQFTKQNGTQYTIVFVGGLMYQLNWGARTISPIALGGGVVVSNSAKLYAVTFSDKLIVSDGVNKPWSWDGTTFVSLANAPVAFGKPVVYYAKLFFINAANRLQFQWSEENDPTIGYATAIYDNTWIFGQADQNPLTALFATNEALYVFRERSIGYVSGAVTRTFRTDGTRSGISGSVGTTSPDSIIYRNGQIWFLDADGQAQVFGLGTEPIPIWEDFRENTRLIPRTILPLAVTLDYTPANLVLMGAAQVGSTIPNMFLVFHPDTREALAIWRGYSFTTAAMVKDDSLRPVIVHLSDDGYVYDHGNPEDSIFDYGFQSGTVAVQHKIVGTPQGWSFEREVDWSELTAIVRANSAMHLNLTYETPRGRGSSQAVVASGGYAVYGVGIYGVSLYAAATPELRRKIGIKKLGRWIKPEILHQTVGERFGFLGWRAMGYAMPSEINVP